ncbi:Uncharacterised protein [Mycobacteroides abscessus subsp. abscessus]|nr:Uncharacterised protein [Mycobacteroides abscessus subsp. abscessus]
MRVYIAAFTSIPKRYLTYRVFGVQHEALIWRGDALRTPEVQGTAVVIENR